MKFHHDGNDLTTEFLEKQSRDPRLFVDFIEDK